MREIKQAMVLGSGVMGATIAAHLANVGIPTYLLDILPKEVNAKEAAQGLTLEDKKVRNRIASEAIKNLAKIKPAAAFTKSSLQMIRPGNLVDHLNLVAEVDWVIEVVIENLAIKKDLLAQVYSYWKPGTYVSTNTSGVSINAMVADLPEQFQAYFLGTHFFNPPRYMKLLEIIPGQFTKPELVEFFTDFGEEILGKGMVRAKDTPNFIANRVGVYGLLQVAKSMDKYDFSVAEADALTGTVMGRPKSASFRTLDMVGLDTFAHVAQNVYDNVTDGKEKERFIVPEFLKEMVAKGWLGDKSKQGFYTKTKDAQGVKKVACLDYKTLTYQDKPQVKFGILEQIKVLPDLKSKMRALIKGDQPENNFAWEVLKGVMLYSAWQLNEMADDLVAVDKAMKWGFNWEMGPFETWDALGFKEVLTRMLQEKDVVPPWVLDMVDEGQSCFYQYQAETTTYYDQRTKSYLPLLQNEQVISLAALKKQNRVIKSNPGVTLIDLGDGVAALEFHSPNNAIGQDIMEMIVASVAEVEQNYQGLVIGNQGKNFCVGANLMLLLIEAQKGNWAEIELIVRQFQQSVMALKYCQRPVVAAPFGMTLGGGYEICAHSSEVQANAESYIGLVELGVGLIPAGGGCKEILYRAYEGAPLDSSTDLFPFLRKAFETISLAKVSTSGMEAKELGYLRKCDGISINGTFQLAQAKNRVLGLAKSGYRPPVAKSIPVLGEQGIATLKLFTYSMNEGSFISDYDRLLADKVAEVLSGGRVTPGTMVSEQYLLDLEREAFLSLIGQPKTQERMLHMLTKGKPLRN